MKQSANVQLWRRLSLLLLAVTGIWLASATQAFAAEGPDHAPQLRKFVSWITG
jgi:hypothetical protein